MLVVITETTEITVKWTHLPVGNCVVIYSHLGVHVFQVPAEAPAFQPLPQGHPLWHVPEIHPWVLLGEQTGDPEYFLFFFFSHHDTHKTGKWEVSHSRTWRLEELTRGEERGQEGRKEKKKVFVFPHRKPMCQSSGTLIVLSLGVIQCCANSNQLFNYERSRPCWLREREASQIDVGNT